MGTKRTIDELSDDNCEETLRRTPHGDCADAPTKLSKQTGAPKKERREQSLSDHRQRVVHLVGTVCHCARARKRHRLSCNKQFRGDVDEIAKIRLELRRLHPSDMDMKVGRPSVCVPRG